MLAEGKDGSKTNPKSKSFKVLEETAGVKAATLQKLIDNDFDSLPAVKLLQDPDIAALELSLDQTQIVAKWRESLNAGKKKKARFAASPVTDRVTPATQPGAEEAHELTAASLARDKDLTQLSGANRGTISGSLVTEERFPTRWTYGPQVRHCLYLTL